MSCSPLFPTASAACALEPHYIRPRSHCADRVICIDNGSMCLTSASEGHYRPSRHSPLHSSTGRRAYGFASKVPVKPPTTPIAWTCSYPAVARRSRPSQIPATGQTIDDHLRLILKGAREKRALCLSSPSSARACPEHRGQRPVHLRRNDPRQLIGWLWHMSAGACAVSAMSPIVVMNSLAGYDRSKRMGALSPAWFPSRKDIICARYLCIVAFSAIMACATVL